MKRQLLYATTAALLFAACSEPLQEAVEINNEAQSTDAKTIELSPEEMSLIERIANKSPKVSPETAQETALHLLGMQNQPASISKKMKTAVFCNKKSIYNKLSKSYKLEDDTAFYVFNTTDNQGFAIVAADLRVPNQIIAYSDNGSFDTETDNPGLALFLDLAKGYVADCIATADAQEDSLTESICNKLGIDSQIKTQNSLSKVKELQRIKCTTMGEPTVTVVDKDNIKPLLKTEWSQDDPYNLKCGGNAGCVPIAVSQIMAYWRYPDVLNGYRLDWNFILNGDTASYYYKEQVSSLIQIIREGGKTDGGSTKQTKALKYMRNIRLTTQNQYYDYDHFKVIDAVKKNKPVYMIGSKSKNTAGHAWIVDGYLNRHITTDQTFKYCIVEELDNGTITYRYEDIPSTTTVSYMLFHINWGWGGSANGYYNVGIFDTNRQMVEDKDKTFHQTSSTFIDPPNYNTNLEIITEIKPR